MLCYNPLCPEKGGKSCESAYKQQEELLKRQS